jgi:hypothetical protein
LSKLGILRRICRGQVPEPALFRVTLRIREGIIQFVSLPTKEPAAPLTVEAVDWPALTAALCGGHIKAICWDHSQVKERFCYHKGAVSSGDLYLDSGWSYSFAALLALAKRDPPRVVALLRYAAGADDAGLWTDLSAKQGVLVGRPMTLLER